MVFDRQEKKQKSLKRKIILSVILVAFTALTSLSYGYIVKNKMGKIQNEKRQFLQEASSTEEAVFLNETSGLIRTNSGTASIPEGTFPESENFLLVEASLGGDQLGDLSSESRNTPLKVYNIRSETVTSKDGKSSMLLIYWKTNRLARSKVLYKKSGSSTDKELKEDGVGFSHALVIPKFDLDTRYLYRIEAQDRWGNIIKSEEFAAYSGKRNESVMELISEEFKDIFKWAVK